MKKSKKNKSKAKRTRLTILIIVMLIIDIALAYGVVLTYNDSEYAANMDILQPALQDDVDDPTEEVPVLVYGGICTEDQYAKVDDKKKWTSDVDFRDQIAYLKEQGYITLSTEEYCLWQQELVELPQNVVLITFDHAGRNVLELAAPILDEFDYRATAFVVGSEVAKKGGSDKYDAPMTWDDLKTVEADYPQIDIQSQSYDMYRKVDSEPVVKSMTSDEFEADVEDQDAAFEKAALYLTAYAYPYGESTKELDVVLENYGYELGFSKGKNSISTRADGPYGIPRIKVEGNKSIDDFAKLLKK